MERRLMSGIMLPLLLISTFILAFNIQGVKGWAGTVYIGADGGIDPPDAPISSVDNVTYTFADSIFGSIVVQKNDIVIDGAGYTLQGIGAAGSIGIDLTGRTNVTIRNTQIKNNDYGIMLDQSSNYNSISGNNITNTYWGILLYYSSDNRFYHNNFIDNNQQFSVFPSEYANVWDDGYPSGGNYWSDYITRYPSAQELDDSGIWDTPYVLDENNKDNYPLIEPWTPTPPEVTATIDIDPDTLNLRSYGHWITAYIQLPEGYNAADIDASTILVNGSIAPVLDPKYGFVTNSSEYLVDYDNDSILERMVKFDRAIVESWIYQSIGMRCDVSLTMTGKLLDGTLFEGTDTIFVFWINHRPPSKR